MAVTVKSVLLWHETSHSPVLTTFWKNMILDSKSRNCKNSHGKWVGQSLSQPKPSSQATLPQIQWDPVPVLGTMLPHHSASNLHCFPPLQIETLLDNCGLTQT